MGLAARRLFRSIVHTGREPVLSRSIALRPQMTLWFHQDSHVVYKQTGSSRKKPPRHHYTFSSSLLCVLLTAGPWRCIQSRSYGFAFRCVTSSSAPSSRSQSSVVCLCRHGRDPLRKGTDLAIPVNGPESKTPHSQLVFCAHGSTLLALLWLCPSCATALLLFFSLHTCFSPGEVGLTLGHGIFKVKCKRPSS